MDCHEIEYCTLMCNRYEVNVACTYTHTCTPFGKQIRAQHVYT